MRKIGGIGWASILIVFSLTMLFVVYKDFIVLNIKDIGVNSIGAYLGFIGAAVIYLIQIGNDRSKGKREALEKHKEHLRYFAGIIDDVAKYAQSQSGFLGELGSAIKKQPSSIHQLVFVASDSIGRLNRADNEAVFHAYNTLFAGVPEHEKNYRIILAKTDFLASQLVAVKQSFLDYRDSIYKRQLKLKDIIQVIADETAFLLNELRQDEPAYTFAKYAPSAEHELNDIILRYVELNSKLVPFEEYFEKFIEPLKIWLNTNNDFFPFKHASYKRRENLVRLTKGASVSLTDLTSDALRFMLAFNPQNLSNTALEMDLIVKSLKEVAKSSIES